MYNQRYPQSEQALADQAKNKNLLGYHDIRVGNELDDRLDAFFRETLPSIAAEMRERYNNNYDLVSRWAYGAINYEEFAARVRRREEGAPEDFDA